MSKQDVESFLRCLSHDPQLRARVDSIAPGPQDAMLAELARIASEQGLPFTVEEFRQAASMTGVELNETELQGVAGGLLCDRFTSKMSLASARGKNLEGWPGDGPPKRSDQQS